MVTKHENITSTVDFETGEWVYNVTRQVRINREMVLGVLDMDGTGYWARDGKVQGDAIIWTVHEAHEYGENGKEQMKYRATFERLAKAIVEIAEGKHNLWGSIEEECRESIDEGAWIAGTDVNDCVIQVALFGKVIYG
jgi:hypothetical protein